MIDTDDVICGLGKFQQAVEHLRPLDTDQMIEGLQNRVRAEGIDPDALEFYVTLEKQVIADALDEGDELMDILTRSVWSTALFFTFLTNTHAGGHNDDPRRNRGGAD